MENFLFLTSGAVIAAFLFYFLFRRGGYPDEAPAAGSVFSGYGTEVRVRDIFRLALTLEEKGADLYERLEKAADEPGTKKLCAWLAGQEKAHGRLIKSTLEKWRSLHPHLTGWAELLRLAEKQGFFSAPPPSGASEKELGAYAIEQERKSVEFYSAIEASFPQAWKRARLHRLAEEERTHLARLREVYPGN